MKDSFLVGVSVGTIVDDVKLILKRLRENQIQDYGDRLALEESRLDEALKAIWPKIASGNLSAIDRLLKIWSAEQGYLASMQG